MKMPPCSPGGGRKGSGIPCWNYCHSDLDEGRNYTSVCLLTTMFIKANPLTILSPLLHQRLGGSAGEVGQEKFPCGRESNHAASVKQIKCDLLRIKQKIKKGSWMDGIISFYQTGTSSGKQRARDNDQGKRSLVVISRSLSRVLAAENKETLSDI